ncbi:hypothetical protein NE237_023202 [Protea cynaroides]|uniref:VQ domain-containing protein n=1 Tax=Protea cynaroides TaxID=273540 RepID=A0A9Q0HEH1_9MAGN|nr:hypothetical protein NE237_023202 [Protea cynaroides]
MNEDNMVMVVDQDESRGVRVRQPLTPPPPPSLSTLRSVRKRLAKPWKKPMPMAMQQLPPPPKVYRVDSTNFRKLVQQLTGAPEIQSQRLHSKAPPPLDLFHSDNTCKSRTQQQCFMTTEREGSSSFSASQMPVPGNLYMSDDSWGLFGSSVMSPTYASWPSSFAVLSPGALASLEQSSTILY